MVYWSRTINYAVYKRNPSALALIICKVRQFLKPIPGVIRAEVTNIRDSKGAGSDSEWNLQIRILFVDQKACALYDSHDLHKQYVRFVLCGWQLEGSQAPDPQIEFEEYILSRAKGSRVVRNPDIPDHQVVWEKEEVVEGFTEVYEDI